MKTKLKTTNALRGLLSGLLLLAAGTFSAHAAVTLSDFGVTAPVLNPSTDTGYTTVNTSEARIRGGNTTGQTFVSPITGLVDKIYLAYNAFGVGQPDGLIDFTFRLDVNNDGSYEINQSFVGFSVSGFAASQGTTNWMEFDLSAENITLAAATTHSFRVTNNEPFDVGRGIWEQWHETTNVYANGISLGSGVDLIFGVTTSLPEPSRALLLLGGLMGVVMRRRRKL